MNRKLHVNERKKLKSDYDNLNATNDSNLAKFNTLHDALASLLEENVR